MARSTTRIGLISGLDELDEKAKPIAPPHLAFAFRHSMQPCEISIRIKVLLFKLYERLECARAGGVLQRNQPRPGGGGHRAGDQADLRAHAADAAQRGAPE